MNELVKLWWRNLGEWRSDDEVVWLNSFARHNGAVWVMYSPSCADPKFDKDNEQRCAPWDWFRETYKRDANELQDAVAEAHVGAA